MSERGIELRCQPSPVTRGGAAAAFKAKMAAAGKSRCQVCRWKPPAGLALLHDEPASMLHAHHVIPIACRGADDEKNLVLLCPTHHAVAHKLGRMVNNPRWGWVWLGPKTPTLLLREIRLLEKDPAGWAAHVERGRDYDALAAIDQQTEAESRRASFRLSTTTNRATSKFREIFSAAENEG